jgi:serine/threonine protein kinase
VALEHGGKVACLDEEAALDFVQGRLGEAEVERLDEHVDQCGRCRMVLAEATRAFRERTTAAAALARVPFTRFAPGDVLAERYRVLRFIARGGMGEVYEAEDLILNTRLALKTLAATISDDPHAIRRLKQEVNLARRITHPNVCRIFDLGVHQPGDPGTMPGQLFLTMELVPGRSLGECLRKEGRLDPAKAIPIVESMVAALAAAHRAKVVHRDFKSDNVMLAAEQGSQQGDQEGGQPRTVVMDFGLARAAVAADTSSVDGHSLIGTLPYMSPEQLAGGSVGPATDIYALGVVLFEMLTGQLPFKDRGPIAAAWKRVVEPPPPLASLVEGLDPGWQQIVARCLERDPARRPSSVEELGPLLGRLKAGEGSRSRSRRVRSRLWARPGVLALGGFGAALTVLFLVTWSVRGGGHQAHTRPPIPASTREETPSRPLPSQPDHLPESNLEARPTVGPALALPAILPRPPTAEIALSPNAALPQPRSNQRRRTLAARTPVEPQVRPAIHEEVEAAIRHSVDDPGTFRDFPAAPAGSPTAPAPRRSTDPNDGFIFQP